MQAVNEKNPSDKEPVDGSESCIEIIWITQHCNYD